MNTKDEKTGFSGLRSRKPFFTLWYFELEKADVGGGVKVGAGSLWSRQGHGVQVIIGSRTISLAQVQCVRDGNWVRLCAARSNEKLQT